MGKAILGSILPEIMKPEEKVGSHASPAKVDFHRY